MKFLVFLVICVASASCADFESLCPADHFKYNGLMVNSFHRSQQSITFPSLSEYLIDSSITCDRSQFANKTNFLEALKLKNAFNRKFAEFYSKDLSTASAEEIATNEHTLSVDYWIPINDMKWEERKAKCVEIFDEKAFAALNVLVTLQQLMQENLFPTRDFSGFKPNKYDQIAALGRLIGQLKTNSDQQKFPLKTDPMHIYFHGNLAQHIEFKWLTDGEVTPNTQSQLTYEQFLPLHSVENADNVEKECVPLEKLPLFYTWRGHKKPKQPKH